MEDTYIAKIKTNNEENFPIQLTPNERIFLIDCQKHSKNYLEFGSGGSTFLALKHGSCEKIVSVESDPDWLVSLRKYKIISEYENSKLFFNLVDIGKTGQWGFPIEQDKKELFSNYSSEVFNKFPNDYDLVLIDGRFRVACTLQTILNCKPDVKILMHDYNNRPQYHCILEFLNITYTIDTMAMFVIKPNIDKNRLLEAYDKFKYIPA